MALPKLRLTKAADEAELSPIAIAGLEPFYADPPAAVEEARSTYKAVTDEHNRLSGEFSAACREAHAANLSAPSPEMKRLDTQIKALDIRRTEAKAALKAAHTDRAEAIYAATSASLRAAEVEIERDVDRLLDKLQALVDAGRKVPPGDAQPPAVIQRAPALAAKAREMRGALAWNKG